MTSGTLNDTDWEAIKQSKGKLQIIDLAGATYEGTDKGNLTYNQYSNGENNTLITIKLPQGVTALGREAFYYCHSLTSIDLPEGLTNIGEGAFLGCNLNTITLPEELTNIGSFAFSECHALGSVILPTGLESIGNKAFSHCLSLATVTCLATEPLMLGTNVFDVCPALANIYVPAEAVGDYQAAPGWSAYSGIIRGSGQ